MIRTLAILCLLLPAAALAQAAKPPAKAAPKGASPTAKAAPARPAAPTGPFDAQNPQSLIALLGGLGATATISERAEDSVFLKITSPAGDFTGQFAGCDAQGRKCKAMAFDAASSQRTATIAEVNAFNQTSLMCRVWQAKDGKPHVMYSTLVSAGDTRAEIETHLAAWRGCLGDFGAFLKDPPGYLSTAP